MSCSNPKRSIRNVSTISGELQYLAEPGNKRVEAFWLRLTADLGEDVPLPVAMPD
jgi:hypothetical protein